MGPQIFAWLPVLYMAAELTCNYTAQPRRHRTFMITESPVTQITAYDKIIDTVQNWNKSNCVNQGNIYGR